MKDYNFVIWGAKQNFPHKEGGWSKRGGGLQQFCSLRGGVGQKERGDFFEGGVHTLVSTMPRTLHMVSKSLMFSNLHVVLKI